LFGNNAYLNTRYMATPFLNVSSGSKDDYNYFYSQVCIQVKWAFGQLVSRWGILISAIPCNVTIVKTVALVSCLARLHNFCIDHIERSKNRGEDILPLDLLRRLSRKLIIHNRIPIMDITGVFIIHNRLKRAPNCPPFFPFSPLFYIFRVGLYII
jgi:hypothetical protein